MKVCCLFFFLVFFPHPAATFVMYYSKRYKNCHFFQSRGIVFVVVIIIIIPDTVFRCTADMKALFFSSLQKAINCPLPLNIRYWTT